LNISFNPGITVGARHAFTNDDPALFLSSATDAASSLLSFDDSASHCIHVHVGS